jgi:hypothetical protein
MEKGKKERKVKTNFLKSKFLPYCGKEWVSSVFSEYTGCSPIISGPQVLDCKSHSRYCPPPTLQAVFH